MKSLTPFLASVVSMAIGKLRCSQQSAPNLVARRDKWKPQRPGPLHLFSFFVPEQFQLLRRGAPASPGERRSRARGQSVEFADYATISRRRLVISIEPFGRLERLL
jgi:hypothetical protein